MPEKYTRQQLQKLYQKLPEELKEALWSEEGTQAIWDVCEKNKVKRKSIPEITEYVGYVLLGILPPEDFVAALEKEVGLGKAKAKKVAQEIHRHIFFPVRSLLAELYKVEVGAGAGAGAGAPAGKPSAPPAAAGGAEPAPSAPAEAPTAAPPAKEKPKKPDVYREPIE